MVEQIILGDIVEPVRKVPITIDGNPNVEFTRLNLGDIQPTDITAISRLDIRGDPDVSSAFYIPRHYQLGTYNRLYHAIIEVGQNGTQLGIYPGELACKPYNAQNPNRIPDAKYGIWRLLLQINNYTSKKYKAQVEVSYSNIEQC